MATEILHRPDAIRYRVLVEQRADGLTSSRNYMFFFDRPDGPSAARYDPQQNERLDAALANEAYDTLENLANGLVESFSAFTANQPGEQQLLLYFERSPSMFFPMGAGDLGSSCMEFSIVNEGEQKGYEEAYMERSLDPGEREYLFHVLAAKLLARYGRAPPYVRPPTSPE